MHLAKTYSGSPINTYELTSVYYTGRFSFWPCTWLTCFCQKGFSFAFPLPWKAIPIIASTASKAVYNTTSSLKPSLINPPKLNLSLHSRSPFYKNGCSHFRMISLRICCCHSYFSWLWHPTYATQYTPVKNRHWVSFPKGTSLHMQFPAHGEHTQRICSATRWWNV